MLAEPLSDEDCGAQSMPDASPVKWHLAHTTWFFETFILESMEAAFAPFHPAFRVLFNSYYNGVGEKHPRAQRGLLTRPGMAQVRAYRVDVDARIARLLAGELVRAERERLTMLLALGLEHEQQHQELLLTDVKHLLAQSALFPAYLDTAHLGSAVAPAPARAQPATWLAFDGGLAQIGHAGDGFCFDNELPRHPQYVAPFELASALVTNGEFLAFIEAGGYRTAHWWLAEGWDWVRSQHLACPLYWQRDEAGHWQEFTLSGLRPLDLQAPATHLSLFEADAYAHWAGARLPTEAEWELAAQGVAVEVGQLHPAAGAPGHGLAANVRPLLAVDQQQLRAVSRLPHGARGARRIQRQVHAEPVCAARLVVRHAGRPCARQLPQFLPGRRALAIFRHPPGAPGGIIA